MARDSKIAKKLLLPIKDIYGVIRIIESYNDIYITYYSQSIDKNIFIKRQVILIQSFVEKIHKSKVIGQVPEIKHIGQNKYNITWEV